MKVAYHLGAHSTDEDRLLRSLLRNRRLLEADGTVVAAPPQFRVMLRDTLMALKGAPAGSEVQQAILDALTDVEPVGRIIFSHEFFLSITQRVITPEGFYRTAARKLLPLANLFPDAETEFFMAIMNPATLIPALLLRTGTDYETLMAGQDPRALRWAPLIAEMAAASGGRRLVLWANEDTPLIWPEVLRRMTGLPTARPMAGDDAVLEAIMEAEGFAQLQGYLEAEPPQTVAERRRIVGTFLERFAIADRLEAELPLPGWTDDLVEEITEIYEADVAEISAMPGVEFIEP